jgi:asparagine synthase (glutamine-hydrolysing)
MCGICGKLAFDAEHSVPKSLVQNMADTIRHRGPDDDGLYVAGQIGLGFRRLAIIDLAGGHQPLSNEDDTIWLVFNGEIYNYIELRNELLVKGHLLKTKSDTEVIVHLYEEYGTDCLMRLRGMFAFALWDNRRKVLFLARDRVGIKPLYYFVGKNFLSFGSEIKAILSDPAVNREVDPAIVDRFLTHFYVPGAETLLRNLYKLEPGHALTVKDGSYRTWRYWDLEFPTGREQSFSARLERELVELLDETVQLHMISDVPVGFLLSGGVDSAAMLAFGAGKTDKPISTYTIGFSDDDVVDERPFARLAAAHFGTEHHEISVTPDQFASFLPQYVWYMEEPICQPPAVALYYVSKLASQHVKVLISGEGGDEAFAGYENYRNNFWLEKIKRILGPLRSPVAKAATLLGKMLDASVFERYGHRMGVDFDDYYFSRTASPFGFFSRRRDSIYSDSMARLVDADFSTRATRMYLSKSASYGILDRMLYVDTNTWLPDDLLIKADKMTMANSVELRVPLLDHKVLEFAARLPRKMKINGWKMKHLPKKALKSRVPREILSRRKAGFPVPFDGWLRTAFREWIPEILLDRRTRSRGYFKANAFEQMVRNHGKDPEYPHAMFSLLVLELWHRTFVDGSPDAEETESLPVPSIGT